MRASKTVEARRNTRSVTASISIRYYDKVISRLTEYDGLLIFGPGEAKLELKERLSRSETHSERTVAVETTDKLTDPQIVAKVKEHFGIDLV